MRLTLKTPRLTLRPPEDADAEALARAIDDIEIARNSTGIPHPYTSQVALGWIAIARAVMRRRVSFNWLIVESESASSGAVAGGIGVFKRGASPDWEVGYWISRNDWGRGYATEALDAVLDWARTDLGAKRIVAGHYDDNPGSRRVLEKAGFQPTGCAGEEYSLARNARAVCVGMALELGDAASAV